MEVGPNLECQEIHLNDELIHQILPLFLISIFSFVSFTYFSPIITSNDSIFVLEFEITSILIILTQLWLNSNQFFSFVMVSVKWIRREHFMDTSLQTKHMCETNSYRFCSHTYTRLFYFFFLSFSLQTNLAFKLMWMWNLTPFLQ